MKRPLVFPESSTDDAELQKLIEFFNETLGFCPNSVKTMHRRPRIAYAFIGLNKAVMENNGRVTSVLKGEALLRPHKSCGYFANPKADIFFIFGTLQQNPLTTMTNSTLTGCDLFSGAGGMSLGAELAGIKVSMAVENDKYAAETFKKNHPQTTLVPDDIRSIDPTKFFKKNPFIVFGGPPCQGFSLSNTVTRNLENKHNSLFEEFLRFIKILEPEWCVFENVEGFVSFQKGMIAATLKERLEKLGYSVLPDVLNASAYGVPQDRNRFFMVGNRKGKSFKFPKPQKIKFTVKDALTDLPSLRNGDNYETLPYKKMPENKFALRMRKGSKEAKQNLVSRNKNYVIERYQYIKPGQNWKAIPERLMKNYKDREQCHSGIYKRLNPERASVIISNFRKNMLIHPFEDRGLSLREAARLQSFPDKFIFCGLLMYMQQQIVNAVPPLLAKAVA